MSGTALSVKHLSKSYRSHGSVTDAVRDVTLSVRKGECFGIVGESGSGKSTLARLIMCLEKADAGEIYLGGERLDLLGERALKPHRRRFQMVFQDSGSSLNPRKQIARQILDPLRYHGLLDGKDPEEVLRTYLDAVGLAGEMGGRYPHELSGGQRQRVCLARAMALEPEILILDEPVSALDVSIQAQILNLLRRLQQEMHLTMVFIGHGLGAVHYVSDRLAVMYAGQVVEEGDSDEVFSSPCHPYTRALVDAAPSGDVREKQRARVHLKGELGRVGALDGCPLLPRCPYSDALCSGCDLSLRSVDARGEHLSRCMRARDTGEEAKN